VKEVSTMLQVGLVAVLSLAIAGCNNSTTPTGGANVPSALVRSVSPADGATNVPLQTTISIEFSQPMDANAIRESVHLVGGDGMRDWLDFAHPESGFGNMSYNDYMHMMGLLDSLDMSGEFVWEDGFERCEFHPDSGFVPQENYMLIMDEDGMMNGGMGHMGHTGNMGMNGANRDLLMYRFETGRR